MQLIELTPNGESCGTAMTASAREDADVEVDNVVDNYCFNCGTTHEFEVGHIEGHA